VCDGSIPHSQCEFKWPHPLTKCVLRGTNRHALRRAHAQPAAAPVRRRGPVSAPRQIDALDQRIIEALQENGRESFRRIAAQVGVSEATVRARYARLCGDDILQVVGVTNPLGLGFEQALVGVKTAGSPQPVADEIATWDEADYVVVTAGQYDLIVEIVAAHRRELLELTDRMRALDGVMSTETFLYLDMVKQLYDWGTRVPEEVR
jgi:Lrp/AsnC family transcriptional regulator, regulator for asnA, asnC and gidA